MKLEAFKIMIENTRYSGDKGKPNSTEQKSLDEIIDRMELEIETVSNKS